MPEWLIVLLVLTVFFLGVFPLFLMGTILWSVLLVRTGKDKWKRGPSMPEKENYMRIFEKGMAWREKHLDRMEEVQVQNGKLRLAGEYYDFGCDKAVIILPGRMETCYYCAFFAEPYEKAGYNVLAIDNRAHGDSDGRFNTLGHKEYRDVLCWAKMLHDQKGVKQVFLHGVCIGSCTAAFTLSSADCPDYVSGMVGEGMFESFWATFLTHLKEQGHKPFPVGVMAMLMLLLVTGVNVFTNGPKKQLPKVRKPVLMIHSREDIYSLPAKAEMLYASLTTPVKRMVWFDHGFHSMIRDYSEEYRERYDREIRDFLQIAEGTIA